MAADVPIGSPTDALIRFTDANGSPYTGAPSAGGSASAYGPASATAVVAGPTTVSDYGDGWYGIPLTAAQTATAGLYRMTIPTITFSGRIFTNQTVLFTVGDVPPEQISLRGIITKVVQALGCGLARTTTSAGTTATLVDSYWIDSGYATNDLIGDEVLILEPVAGDANPLTVTAFNPTTGTLTFRPALAGNLATAIDYLLIRASKAGVTYDQIRAAIDAAIADLASRQRATDEVTLTTSATTNRYSLPASWLAVERVEINRVQGSTWEYWETFPPGDYDWIADRRLLIFKQWPGYSYPLRVTGRVAIGPPPRLSGLVRLPWPAVVNTVAGLLGLSPAQQAAYRVQSGRAMAGRR
jgi:hypothetical protein